MKDETDTRPTTYNKQVVAAALKGAQDMLRGVLGDDIAVCIALVDEGRNQRQLAMNRCDCGHQDIHLLRLLDEAQRVVMSGQPARMLRIEPAAPERAN